MKKIIEILKKLPSVIHSRYFRSSIFVGLSKILSSLLNLVFMIYAVNILSKTENGKLQYYLGFLPVILAIAEFGLPSALVKYLATSIQDPIRSGEVLLSSLIIKLTILFFLFLFGLAFFFSTGEDPFLLLLLILGGFFLSFLSYFESIFITLGEYLLLSIWNPLANIFRLTALFIADQNSKTSLTYIDILVIFTITPVFTVIFFFIVNRKNPLNWSAEVDKIKSTIRELSTFNLWAFVAAIFAIVSDRLEIFLLNKYHTPDKVAIYGTTLQLFSGFLIVLATMNSIILPGLVRRIHTEEFRPFLIKILLSSGVISLCLLPGILLAEPVLTLLFGGKYNESIPVFKILYPNYLLQLVFAPLGMALFAMGKPKIPAILAFLRLVFGVIVGTYLIPEYGVNGAGYSFFLGQIVSWLILAGYFLSLFLR